MSGIGIHQGSQLHISRNNPPQKHGNKTDIEWCIDSQLCFFLVLYTLDKRERVMHIFVIPYTSEYDG